MTVQELYNLLAEEIKNGHGNVDTVISVDIDDGDFGRTEFHNVNGICHMNLYSYGGEVVEIEKDYYER